MKKLIICSIVLFSFAFAKAQTTKVWSLQECVQYAIEQNIDIKQADLNIEVAKLDKKDALGALLPTLNANANNSWNTGLTQNITTGVLQTQTTRNSSYGISSGVTLFDGWANVYRLQRAKMNILAREYNSEQIEDNTLLNVANSYLTVLFNKENLKRLETQHELTGEQIKLSSQLVEAGSIPRGDLLEIRATYANEEQQIIAANNNVIISRIALAQILNLDDYTNFDIEDPNLSEPSGFILDRAVNDIYDAAVDKRFEVKIAEQNTSLAEQDYKIAKAAVLPRLSAFFNYNTRESGQPSFLSSSDNPDPFFDQLSRNDGISYGLSLNIPIFNGWQVSNNIKRSKINVESNRLNEDQTKLTLKRNIYQAYNDAKGSRAAYQSAAIVVEARELAYQYAQERYNVGRMNAFDFNQSQTALANAQSSLLSSKYDYIFKLKVLELFNGIAAEELKL